MTKKIIKEPTIRCYKVTCPICGCEFEFDSTDTYTISDGDGYHRIVVCPACDEDIASMYWDKIHV